MQPEQHDSGGANLRDHVGVLWRRRYVILAIVATASIVAYVLAARQTPMYRATTTLAFEDTVNMSNPLAGQYMSSLSTASLETQGIGTAVKGPEVEERLRVSLGSELVDRVAYSVEGGAQKSDDVNFTNLATITVTSPDPQQAAALANGYAEAVISFRVDRQKATIDRGVRVLKNKLKSFRRPETRTSADYILLKQRLQDLEILAATLTGDFRVVAPATAPDEPFEPKPLRSAALGLAVGVFAGIATAFVVEQFDTRLRDYREAGEILHMPVIGRIPRIDRRALREDPLVVVSHPGGSTAEAFRLLRGNLQFVNVDAAVSSIFVASCLAGEGKSLTIANLAATLALGDKQVILLDADLRKPSLHTFFDIGNEIGLSTLLTGQSSLDETIHTVDLIQPGHGGNGSGPEATDGVPQAALRIIPAGPEPPNPGELIASKSFSTLIDSLERMAQVVLVDTPAMLAVGDVAALSSSIDGVIMLVDFGRVRRATLRDAADIIRPLPCRRLGVITAREHVRRDDRYRYAYRDAQPRAGR